MATWICPFCEARMTVKPGLVGQTKACVKCEMESEITDADALAAMLKDGEPGTEPEASGHKQYKVLAKKDGWFSARFDPTILEQALNAHARQGWVLKAAVTASIRGLIGGDRDEILLIMER